MLIALMVFAFSSASCGGPIYHSPPAATATPMPPVDLSPIIGDDSEPSPATAKTQESTDKDESFELLRSAALLSVPDDNSLNSAVTRYLITCDNDSITLALPIRLPDMANDISDGASRRYHVMEVAACKYCVRETVFCMNRKLSMCRY